MQSVYIIAGIERFSELEEADNVRLGRRVIPMVELGKPAFLVHAEDSNKAIRTSPVTEVLVGEGNMWFKTRHSEYHLTKEAVSDGTTE